MEVRINSATTGQHKEKKGNRFTIPSSLLPYCLLDMYALIINDAPLVMTQNRPLITSRHRLFRLTSLHIRRGRARASCMVRQ
jgi:hypothetical protein